MSRSAKSHILLVLITAIWGTTFVVVKAALTYSSPLTFNAVRMCLAAVALCLLFRKQWVSLTPQAALSGAVVGFYLWLGYEFQTSGLKITTASKSAFLTGVSVVLVPVFLAVFYRRHIRGWTLAGVALACTGLYFLTIPSTTTGALDFSSINRGDLLTIAAAVSFAFQIILVGHATRKYPFQQIATVQVTVCAVLMTLTVPALERPQIVWNSTVVMAVLVTALLATAAAFSIQAWAQQSTPPTHAALIFSLEPVFAWATSLVFLGERLGLRAGLGGAFVLAGVLVSELKGSAPAALTEEIGNDVLEGSASEKACGAGARSKAGESQGQQL